MAPLCAADLVLAACALTGDPAAGHRAAAQGSPLSRSELVQEQRPARLLDRQAAAPRRLRIPAIGVSARIGALGLEPGGTMETPRRFENTGWFKPGPEPGERGAAVIAGHVDSKSGPAVFYRLGELRRGDLIHLRRADGSRVRFRVEGLERRAKSRFPTRKVFARTRASTLRLITCSGSFDRATGHYVDNTIVYAVRVAAAH